MIARAFDGFKAVKALKNAGFDNLPGFRTRGAGSGSHGGGILR